MVSAATELKSDVVGEPEALRAARAEVGEEGVSRKASQRRPPLI